MDKLTTTLIAGSLALGAVGGVVATPNTIEYVIVNPNFTDQQLYIANEIANGRVPKVKTPDADPSKFQTDLIEITAFVQEDINRLAESCLKYKKVEDCDLNVAIKSKVEELSK